MSKFHWVLNIMFVLAIGNISTSNAAPVIQNRSELENIHPKTNLPQTRPDLSPEIKRKYDYLQQKTKSNPQVLLTPEIKEVKFDTEIPASRTYLKSGEIFKILSQSSLMKAIPKGTLDTDPDFGSTTINTPFGTITQMNGGYYSAGVYDVKISSNYTLKNGLDHFIIKIIGWGGKKILTRVKKRTQTPIKEIQDMERIQQVLGPLIQKNIEEDPLFPKIALHEKAFFYFAGDGEKHFLTVLPIAPGQSAKSLIESQISDSSAPNSIMMRIGKSLGKFHYKLASQQEQEKLASTSDFLIFKTIVHGDFHLDNIFISPDNISFIDNASISDSLTIQKSPLEDILRLYSFNLILREITRPQQYFHKFKHSFLSFIDGYVSAYPEAYRGAISQTIYNALETLDGIAITTAQAISDRQDFAQESTIYSKLGMNWAVANIIDRLKNLITTPYIASEIIKKLSIRLIDPPINQTPFTTEPQPSANAGYENRQDNGYNSY